MQIVINIPQERYHETMAKIMLHTRGCQITVLPEHHGRLIDADALVNYVTEVHCKDCNRKKDTTGKMVYDIGDAPCRACGIGDMLDYLEDDMSPTVLEGVKGCRTRLLLSKSLE